MLRRPSLAFLAAALLLLPACTVVRVDGAHGGPGLEFDGVVEGHAVVGWLANETPLRLSVLEGSQDGSILEFVLWKLLRLEVGLAGASIGVGPLHLGLGVLAYDARAPWLMHGDDEEYEEEFREVFEDDED